jgi:hypothetical protein
MDLFGRKEHEARHEEVERHIRLLVEQVAQLTIDLGETRVELRQLALEVGKKVGVEDVDPSLHGLNEGLAKARAALGDAQKSAEEEWDNRSTQLSDSLEDLRTQLAED